MGARNANGRPPPPAVELKWDEWAELVAAGDRAGPWIALNHVLALNTPWSRGKDGSPDPWNLALIVEFLGPNQEWLYWLPSFAEVGAVVDSLMLLGVAVPGGPPVEPKVVADPAERDAVVRGLRYSRLIVARVLRPPRGPGRAGGLPPIHLVVEFLDPLGGIRYWRPTPLSIGSVRSAIKWVYRWNVENDAEGRRRRGLGPGDGPQAPWAAARWRPPGTYREAGAAARRNTCASITRPPGAQLTINYYLFYVPSCSAHRINRYSEVIYTMGSGAARPAPFKPRRHAWLMGDVGYSPGGGVEPADAGVPEIIMVDIDRLRPDPEQPRRSLNEERLRALADTIKRQGLIEPIEVDEDWVIVTGERRWRAAKMAGLRAVPVRVLRGLTPEQKLERRLVENIQHEPLSDLEKATAIKRLMEVGNYSVLEVSRNIGLSDDEIRHLLSLLEAPPEVKQLVEERKLDASTAGEIAYRLRDRPEAAVEVARRVARSERNRRQLARAMITEVKLKEREPEIAPPPADYSVIYADPPWRYEFAPDDMRSVEAHYPTMETEEIKGYLAAKGIRVAPDAVLFLWATAPKLEDALEVMRAWGFKYRTNMAWVKDGIGTGIWFRGKHELLLLGTRGSPRPPAPEDRMPSVLEAPRGEHSEKPEVVYDIIERMTPGARRIELFARRRRPGWDALGLELESAPA